ncbi:phospholipid methyltransferase [Kribbella orskensis]|uniref:Phospholipid methyltransferase n=1 Tax=Kribbella orskensis TaxID=2512216 RepID=A0ABY2BQ34_9ACTN|nr:MULTISPECIES: isoprenylcysteine carboxylmethyltransferase family protein [Kribbella]TCN39618.1 phospholipid methyltransferase [Kribbella sp. VKM Ac-2500]TCO27600.1 phospholipid methyltransferase [Kribbella orskensis]
MTDPAVLRSLCLLVAIGLVLLLWRRPNRRLAGAALLSFLATFVGIGAANQVAMAAGWWRFEVPHGLFLGIPLDLWLGWAVLWGPIPLLVRHRLPVWVLVLSCGWLDVLLMPRLDGLVHLNHDWLYGELLALAFGLLPAVLLGRWTVDRRRLTERVLLQLITFTGLALWLLPSAVMARGDGEWGRLASDPVWRVSVILQLMALAAVPALAAMVEFAVRGGGTPYPWDPPGELVTTGPYAYVANPMQLSAVLMLGLLAIGTHSWSLAGATAGTVAFSKFVADPHERSELAARLGERWVAYDSQVRPWIVRRTPYYTGSATLYLSETCTICQQTRDLVESTKPVDLTLSPAEGCTVAGLRRALYVGPDGLQASGLAAVARGLEHSGPGWAYLGWLARLPVLRQLLQLLLDGMGGGPRQLPTVKER